MSDSVASSDTSDTASHPSHTALTLKEALKIAGWPESLTAADKQAHVASSLREFEEQLLFGRHTDRLIVLRDGVQCTTPDALPAELKGSFSCVVIDPPFITSDVWLLYVQAAKYLLAPDGLVVCTTVIENAPLLEQHLGVRPSRYLPAIPNLPYQYALYTNFPAAQLDRPNPEVPHDPDAFLAASGPPPPQAAAPEEPLRGAGQNPYDFEAMIERELQRQAQGV